MIIFGYHIIIKPTDKTVIKKVMRYIDDYIDSEYGIEYRKERKSLQVARIKALKKPQISKLLYDAGLIPNKDSISYHDGTKEPSLHFCYHWVNKYFQEKK